MERAVWRCVLLGVAWLALAGCGGSDDPAADAATAQDGAGSGGAGANFEVIDDVASCPVWNGSVGEDGSPPPAALATHCAVEGDVWLIASPGVPLDKAQLAPLGNLRTISGSLFVQGVAATDLEALARLKTVAGDVALLENRELGCGRSSRSATTWSSATTLRCARSAPTR